MDRQEYKSLYKGREEIMADYMNRYNQSNEKMLELIYKQNNLILYWLDSLTRELCEIKEGP